MVVTGGAGFIGSNLVDTLLKDGFSVTVIDNFSTGFRRYLNADNVRVVQRDITCAKPDDLAVDFVGAEAVYHLAANADVRHGWKHPRLDHEQNLVATLNVLDACEKADVPDVVFSSTGSVYGETREIPTPERAMFPLQTSLYAASKVAAEAFLQAHAAAGRVRATIFRFVSVLGPRYSHGHVFDFMWQLRRSPDRLRILGDGTQRKSYMHVDDCVAALMSLRPAGDLEVFNLGTDGFCTVSDSATWISARLGLQPTYEFTGGDRGWIGDNPFIYLDVSKAATAGWRTRKTIKESVEETVDWLVENEWMFDAR